MTAPSLLPESPTAPNGAAWAAILSAAIGGAAFGLLTDGSEASPRIARLLNWYHPSGSLSGVAICAVLIWAAAWLALHARWHHRALRRQKLLTAATCLLVLLALLATFPPLYELL